MNTDILNFFESIIAIKPLLYLMIILATFILEDPSTFAVGYLISSGEMSFYEGLAPLFIGIALGDMALFGFGYFFKDKFLKKKNISKKIKLSNTWIFMARFIPGMRTTTYPLAGYLKIPFGKFMILNLASSVIWTFVLLKFGDQLFKNLGAKAWGVIILIIILMYALERFIRSRLRRKEVAID